MTELGHLTVKVKCAPWRTQNPAAYTVPAPSSAVLLQMRVGTELCHRQPTGPVLVRAGPSGIKTFAQLHHFSFLMNQLFHSLELISDMQSMFGDAQSRQYFTP